jgi:hypothetical protein
MKMKAELVDFFDEIDEVTGRPSGKDNTVRGRRELIDREIKHYEDNG